MTAKFFTAFVLSALILVLSSYDLNLLPLYFLRYHTDYYHCYPGTPVGVADGMADVKTKGMCFLDLPAELRLNIYRYAFSTSVRTALPHPLDLSSVSASVPAQLLAVCKNINSEARPIFFEVTDFALWRPRDLLRLRGVAGRLATRITCLTFSDYSMINKTRIKELRALKSLRAVNFDTRAYGVHIRPGFSSVPLDQLETMAISQIGGEHSPVTELVRQRPGLRYTIDVHTMQYAESIGLSCDFIYQQRLVIHCVAKIEVTLPESAAVLMAKFVTLLRVTGDGEMV